MSTYKEKFIQMLDNFMFIQIPLHIYEISHQIFNKGKLI